MKGDAQPLIKFFDGSDKRFIIPLYQRNYDWKEENCEQLFQDLMKLHNSDRRSHFFGSIVSSIQSGTEDRFIIDGQQRITTVSLLLIAMVNAKKEGLIEAKDAKLVEKIFKRYLVDEYQEDERKVKLKPIKKDMQAFADLRGYRQQVVKCPYEEASHRADMKEMISRFEALNPEFAYTFFTAIERTFPE